MKRKREKPPLVTIAAKVPPGIHARIVEDAENRSVTKSSVLRGIVQQHYRRSNGYRVKKRRRLSDEAPNRDVIAGDGESDSSEKRDRRRSQR